MLPIFDDYLERLEYLHNGIKEAVAGLPQAALDWPPGPEMNSIGVLAAHAAGAERYWIGDVAGQDPSGRDREAEFRSSGVDSAALVAGLDEVLAHSRAVLEGLTPDDLEAWRTSPRDGREYTVSWSLAHALEHTALHLGHIQITRQLRSRVGAPTYTN